LEWHLTSAREYKVRMPTTAKKKKIIVAPNILREPRRETSQARKSTSSGAGTVPENEAIGY